MKKAISEKVRLLLGQLSKHTLPIQYPNLFFFYFAFFISAAHYLSFTLEIVWLEKVVAQLIYFASV